MSELWTATADYLTARLPGHHFQIVPLDFTEIHDAVREANIDFVLANSAFYVELEKLYGVNRIATLINSNLPHQQTTTFGGVIFCRADRTRYSPTSTICAIAASWRWSRDHSAAG